MYGQTTHFPNNVRPNTTTTTNLKTTTRQEISHVYKQNKTSHHLHQKYGNTNVSTSPTTRPPHHHTKDYRLLRQWCHTKRSNKTTTPTPHTQTNAATKVNTSPSHHRTHQATTMPHRPNNTRLLYTTRKQSHFYLQKSKTTRHTKWNNKLHNTNETTTNEVYTMRRQPNTTKCNTRNRPHKNTNTNGRGCTRHTVHETYNKVQPTTNVQARGPWDLDGCCGGGDCGARGTIYFY